MYVRRITIALGILTGCLSPLAAQDALVLSGGGPRGIAHIGVLMAMDSLHRDPAIVVGTSMGALVGALYAAGYSAESIALLVRQQDWDDLFKPVSLPLGPDGDIHMPSWRFAVDLKAFEFSRGFIPDWRSNRMLVRLLADAGIRSRGDFDALPRRFRAVTTDFDSGEQVVLAHGDLARAVRASMAEPGFFPPIVWNDRTLTDGALSDYLPVAVARGLGADFVIGADAFRPTPAITARDPVSLALRGLGLVTVNAHPDAPAPDILIVPDVDPSLAAFMFPDDVEPLLAAGLHAALDSVPPDTRTGAARRAALRAPESLSKLVVETPDPAIGALARRIFQHTAPARYDADALLDAADRLYASGVANGVWLRVDDVPVVASSMTYPRESGEAGGEVSRSSPALVVTVDPPPSVDAAVAAGYDNDRNGRVWAAILGRMPFTAAPTELELAASTNGLARWAALSVRRHSLAVAPLRYLVGMHVRDMRARFMPLGGVFEEQKVRRAGGWAGIELPHIYPDWLLTATVHGERVHVLAGARGTSWGPSLRFAMPTADSDIEPPGVDLESRFGAIEYRRAAARGVLTRKLGRTEFAAVGDVAVVSGGAPPDVVPSLGDQGAMPGLRWGEERGRARVVTGLDVSQGVLPFRGSARLRLRAGVAADEEREMDDAGNWVTGVEIAGRWSLPLAPLSLGFGVNSRGKQRLHVSVGPRF